MIFWLPAAPPPPVKFNPVAVVNLILVFPAPGFDPRFVPRNNIVAPVVLLIAEKVNIVEPPVPELSVTVDCPSGRVSVPIVSVVLVAAILEPLKTSSPPFSVNAVESLRRFGVAPLVALLSSVRVAPSLTVNALLTAVPVPLNIRLPALTVVAPEYVFAPVSVNVPLLFIVSVPAPLPSTPDELKFPVPVNVNAFVLLVILPPNASVPPVAPPIVVALPSVIGLEIVVVPEVFAL